MQSQCRRELRSFFSFHAGIEYFQILDLAGRQIVNSAVSLSAFPACKRIIVKVNRHVIQRSSQKRKPAFRFARNREIASAYESQTHPAVRIQQQPPSIYFHPRRSRPPLPPPCLLARHFFPTHLRFSRARLYVLTRRASSRRESASRVEQSIDRQRRNARPFDYKSNECAANPRGRRFYARVYARDK